MKKTMILGASNNVERYSYKAVISLKKHGYEVIAIGNKKGFIDKTEILINKPELSDIDTISIYLNPINQKEYYDYILKIKPRRLIFNPGTENTELENIATKNSILVESSCTLVLLSTGQY